MRPSLAEFALVGTTLLGLGIAATRWNSVLPTPEAAVLPVVSSRPIAAPLANADLANALLARNPFRHSNRPARVRLGDLPASERPVVARYRPTLTLKGIIGGPPWTAMVHGIPGRRGSAILAVGERADSLLVKSIGSNRVVLVGPDTTWVLTLGRDRP